MECGSVSSDAVAYAAEAAESTVDAAMMKQALEMQAAQLQMLLDGMLANNPAGVGTAVNTYA